MEGKLVYEGVLTTGEPLRIRYPIVDDAQALLDYINTLSHEQTFIRFQGEQVTFDQEKAYITNQVARITNHQSIQLLAFSNDQLIGNTQVDLSDRVEKHIGSFGISVKQEFRNKGIGRLLMRLALEKAQKELKGLKIVTLGVFSINDIAIEMYKEFGFKEYGTLPSGIMYKNGFVDHVYMYKNIDEPMQL